METPAGLVVAAASREEHAAIKLLWKGIPVPLLQSGLTVLPARLSRLVADGLIKFRGARDAFDTFKHVALADSETRYVDRVVTELRQRGRPVGFVVRELLQTQQIRNGPAALWPCAGINGHVAIVEQDERALLEIETVAIGSAAEAEFIPKIASQ